MRRSGRIRTPGADGRRPPRGGGARRSDRRRRGSRSPRTDPAAAQQFRRATAARPWGTRTCVRVATSNHGVAQGREAPPPPSLRPASTRTAAPAAARAESAARGPRAEGLGVRPSRPGWVTRGIFFNPILVACCKAWFFCFFVPCEISSRLGSRAKAGSNYMSKRLT